MSRDTGTDHSCPSGKKSYNTPQDAQLAILSLMKRKRIVHHRGKAYRCPEPECRKWHITGTTSFESKKLDYGWWRGKPDDKT